MLDIYAAHDNHGITHRNHSMCNKNPFVVNSNHRTCFDILHNTGKTETQALQSRENYRLYALDYTGSTVSLFHETSRLRSHVPSIDPSSIQMNKPLLPTNPTLHSAFAKQKTSTCPPLSSSPAPSPYASDSSNASQSPQPCCPAASCRPCPGNRCSGCAAGT